VATPARAQQVLAVVNGIPITSYDVDQRGKLLRMSGQKSTSTKEVLEDLINEKVKLFEAKKYGIEASNADVESSFASMAKRMGLNSAQLTQTLNGQGVNAATLKSRIRSDLAWGNLVRGRFQATLQVGEGDIRAMLGPPSGNEKGAIGHVYTLRPILFIVPRGSPPSAVESRRREAEALRGRVSGCAQAVRAARQIRDVAVRDSIIRDSANLPEAMRTMLNSLEIGKLTAPEPTAQGIEMFALCGKEETKAETPRQHEARQEIFTKRYEEQSKRYLEDVRRSAMVEYK
jgi:peptidyl-prolyl cis-trans isomerase SurA